MAKSMTINKEMKVYVMHFDGGCSTIGWDEAKRWTQNASREMGILQPVGALGSEELYREYQEIKTTAHLRFERTGLRLKCDLHPALVGLEGMKLSATIDGKAQTFYLSKSCGYAPCHLLLPKRGSDGGNSVKCTAEIVDIKRLGEYIR